MSEEAKRVRTEAITLPSSRNDDKLEEYCEQNRTISASRTTFSVHNIMAPDI